MTTYNRDQTTAFERYFAQRVARAKAITPGQKKELIEQLRRELEEEGRVPLSSGPVKIDTSHPIVCAALEGRAVTMGGKVIQKKTDGSISDRMQNLSAPAKIAVMIAIFLLPVMIMGLIMFGRADASEVIEATLTSTPTPTPTITLSPTEVYSPTVAPTTPTVMPTPSPIIIEVTPTPYAFALTEGEAPNSNNDPASIEIAGFSYILSTGKVKNGIWSPAGAEWLAGSELRRVIGLPYEPTLANVLAQIRPGLVIKLRLRSGEIVKYKIAETLRVGRQQIEFLAEKTPSLAVILYGEASPERTVVIANAVQEPADFTIYSASGPTEEVPVIESGSPAIPTLVPTTTETIITDTRTITNTHSGLRVAVNDCNQAERIGGQEPPNKKQKYYVCDITVTALEQTEGTGVSYSQEAFGITDDSEIENTIDWLPPPIPAVSEALGNGHLTAGDSKSGRIAGLIQTSSPVLVWQQAGLRIIIELE